MRSAPCELLIRFPQVLPAPFSQGLFYFFITRQAAAHQQPPAPDPFFRRTGQWHVKQCVGALQDAGRFARPCGLGDVHSVASRVI